MYFLFRFCCYFLSARSSTVTPIHHLFSTEAVSVPLPAAFCVNVFLSFSLYVEFESVFVGCVCVLWLCGRLCGVFAMIFISIFNFLSLAHKKKEITTTKNSEKKKQSAQFNQALSCTHSFFAPFAVHTVRHSDVFWLWTRADDSWGGPHSKMKQSVIRLEHCIYCIDV